MDRQEDQTGLNEEMKGAESRSEVRKELCYG